MTRTMAPVAGAVAVLIALATVGLLPVASAATWAHAADFGDHPPVTSPPARAGCWVRYAATTWNNGFITDVTINNNSATAVRGWRLQWAWPGKQQVSGVWNATVTQAGTHMTARNASWNAAIAPGGRVRFGFQGTYSRTNAAPAWFALNGTNCAVG